MRKSPLSHLAVQEVALTRLFFKSPYIVGSCRSPLAGDAPACFCIRSRERSFAVGDRVTFLLRGQEKSNQKRRPPRLALAGLLPGKSVSRRRAFRSDSCPSEKESTSLSTPAARPVGPDSPPHRGPGRAACHPGPHSVRNRRAVARAEGPRSRTLSRAANRRRFGRNVDLQPLRIWQQPEQRKSDYGYAHGCDCNSFHPLIRGFSTLNPPPLLLKYGL